VKITALETIRLEEFRQQLWLKVHTDEGLVGVGETCLGPLTVEAHIHETIAPHMIGQDPADIDRHARTLRDVFVGYGGTGAESRGNSAFDIALWDLAGQASGRALYELLGGASRESIRIYNTCAGPDYGRGNKGALLASDRSTAPDRGLPSGLPVRPYEDLEAALNRPGELAQELLEEHITGMKIWPFDQYAGQSAGQHLSAEQLARGCSALAGIRDAVGDRMDVMIEMHALWSLPAARRIARASEQFDPYWFEDPVKADDFGACASFAASTRIPMAMGETLGSAATFAQLVERGGVGIVMFDVGWVGGITEAKAIAALADARHLPIAPHDCTGPIVLTAATHLSINAPNALVQETVRAYYTGWYRDVVTELPPIDAGRISAPRAPGLGLALQPDLADRAGANRRISTAADL
jgi:galactonate dehydratase